MAVPYIIRSVYRHMKVCSRLVPGINYSVRRYLLSDAYHCQESWNQRLAAQELQVPCSDFMSKLHENYEKERNISFVDIDILANKIPEVDYNDMDMVEELLYKFRHSPDAFKINGSLAYSVVRGYMQLNLAERLLLILKQKSSYGIFPDYQTANILMDHFINTHKYSCAAEVAYEMMLQEDFSHRSTSLLSLYSSVQHLLSPPEEVEVPTEEAANDEEEEEDWVKLKYLNKPYYDDHFDISEPKLLLGKTLLMLGKHFSENTALSHSLQTFGFGLYEKFGKGLTFLESLAASDGGPTLYESALIKFQECLETGSPRDPAVLEKELGLQTIQDAREEIKMSAEEKESYLERFQSISGKLRDNGKLIPDDGGEFEKKVDAFVLGELPGLEQADIDVQVKQMAEWNEERRRLLDEQILNYRNLEKKKEIQQKLLDLQEKEEILTFFEKKHEIQLAMQIGQRRLYKEERRAPKVKDYDEDIEVEDSAKKQAKSTIKKKKF